jgi:hypothetical protein
MPKPPGFGPPGWSDWEFIHRHWGFPKSWGYPNHPFTDGIFHDKPSSYWVPPCMEATIKTYIRFEIRTNEKEYSSSVPTRNVPLHRQDIITMFWGINIHQPACFLV